MAAINPEKVNSESGVIHGVRVMTVGEAKGHDQFIDEKTLATVLEESSNFPNGIKVKLNHDSGIEAVVGFINNLHLSSSDGKQTILADLHLLNSHPSRDQILELAKSIPDTFGLSLSFSNAPQIVDGQMTVRCGEIYSCDLVTEPAANPSLFSAKAEAVAVDEKNKAEPTNNMNEEFCKLMAEHMAKHGEALSGIHEHLKKMSEGGKSEGEAEPEGKHVIEKKETKPDGSTKHTVEEKAPEPEEDDAEMNAKIEKEVLKRLNAKGIKHDGKSKAISNFGAEKVNEDLSKMKFEDICFSIRTSGLNGRKFTATEAVKFAMGKYPEAHADYLIRASHDGNAMQNMINLARKGQVSKFSGKCEHWKVQGLDFEPEPVQI